MTDPTQLSPAAQAVLDALNETSWDWASMEQASPQTIAAAILRAATDQCKIEWNYHPDYPETEWVVVTSDLLAIAAELETQ